MLEVRAFLRTLPGYAPTPLHELTGLSRALGLGSLYIKDESARFGLEAFKGVGAVWAMSRLFASGARPKMVSSATDGNWGRSLAWAAGRLGISAVIYVPSHTVPARIEAIEREGATVRRVQGTYDDAVRQCAHDSASEGWQPVSDTSYEGYTEIPSWVMDGYDAIFQEADEQLHVRGLPAPNVVLIQGGCGGLLGAATRHFRSQGEPCYLVSVEPVEADCLLASCRAPGGARTASSGRLETVMAGLNCGEVSLVAWPDIRRGVDLFLSIEDEDAARAMRRLARPTPPDPVIVAGESGAAGLAGLLALFHAPHLTHLRTQIPLGRGSRVMVLNTEGATDPAGYERLVGVRPPTP